MCCSSSWTITPNFIRLSDLGNNLQFLWVLFLHHLHFAKLMRVWISEIRNLLPLVPYPMTFGGVARDSQQHDVLIIIFCERQIPSNATWLHTTAYFLKNQLHSVLNPAGSSENKLTVAAKVSKVRQYSWNEAYKCVECCHRCRLKKGGNHFFLSDCSDVFSPISFANGLILFVEYLLIQLKQLLAAVPEMKSKLVAMRDAASTTSAHGKTVPDALKASLASIDRSWEEMCPQVEVLTPALFL